MIKQIIAYATVIAFLLWSGVAVAHNHIQCTNAEIFLFKLKEIGATAHEVKRIDENRTSFMFKSNKLGYLPTVYFKKENVFCYYKNAKKQQENNT